MSEDKNTGEGPSSLLLGYAPPGAHCGPLQWRWMTLFSILAAMLLVLLGSLGFLLVGLVWG